MTQAESLLPLAFFEGFLFCLLREREREKFPSGRAAGQEDKKDKKHSTSRSIERFFYTVCQPTMDIHLIPIHQLLDEASLKSHRQSTLDMLF